MFSTLLTILSILGLCGIGMTISQLENRIAGTRSLHHYVAAPDATTLQTGPWFDMRQFKCFLASYLKTTGTGLLTMFQLVASNQNNGGGTIIPVVSSAFPVVQPDAAGNQVFLECTQQQLAGLSGANGLYNNESLQFVAVQYQQATAGDTGVITYLATEPTVLASLPPITVDSAS